MENGPKEAASQSQDPQNLPADQTKAEVVQEIHVPDIHPDIMKGLQNYLKSQDISSSEVELNRLTGFSNQIFLTKIRQQEVILKKKTHNKGCALYVTYEDEIKQIIKANKFGPSNLYEDPDVVIEELIKGDTMQVGETYDPDLMLLSFEQAAQFNAMRLTEDNLQNLNKRTVMFLDLLDRGARTKALDTLQSVVLSEDPRVTPARKQKVQALLDFLQDQARFEATVSLAKKFEKPTGDPMVVIGHNDMFRMNLMVSPDKKAVTLIDYEYSGLNPIGWDVVNFFIETCMSYKDATNSFELEVKVPDLPSLQLIYRRYLKDLQHFRSVSGQPGFDGSTDQGALADDLSKQFNSIATIINYCWIIWCGLLVVPLQEDERWPLVDYTLQRIELHHLLETDTMPKGLSFFPQQ